MLRPHSSLPRNTHGPTMLRTAPALVLSAALALLAAPLPAADEGYATTLFNGSDLAGWHVTDCEAAVEDGSLVLKSGNGLVRSDHRYGDFVLELDWRARK